MLLFRSEEGIDRGAAEKGVTRGESLSLERIWELSKLWYGGRLDPTYRGRSAAEVEGIFQRVGLTSPFWSA
jgi:hypothetical protein